MTTPEVAVSVIIPTRHRIDKLCHCLNLLAPGMQSLPFKKYEVIVTDDGKEVTAQSLIAGRYPWARWTQGPGRGPAANRNHGATLAIGEWLAFTDDDCLPDEGWLQAFMDAASGAHVLEGRTTCRLGLRRPIYEAPVNESGGCLWSCNFAISRSLYFKTGGFDERFPFASGEDEVFRDVLKFAGITPRFVPGAVIDHPPRRRPFGSQWNKRWQSQVLKERVMGRTVCADRLMPLRIAKLRLRELLSTRTPGDFVWLASSSAIEVANIASRYRSWQRWAGQHSGDDT